MSEDSLIKDIVTEGVPLTKIVIDLWLKPKLQEIGSKWKKEKKIQDHFFRNKFEEYLIEKYKNYSILNILAFRNQQRKIKDLYCPLTVSNKRHSKSLEYRVEFYEDDFIPEFKKVLITDTAGMGKSTLSKILFLSVIEQNKGIPVFIELRRLNKENKVIDEIFSELKLINEEVDKEFILDLVKRGDFVFFFDGYDEISTVDKSEVTKDIQKFIFDASSNYFLLTSRPDESLASFGDFQDFSINPLEKNEAYELLRKYDENGGLSKLLIEKLETENYSNIEEFLTNPLLVSLLFTSFEYKQTIPLKKHLFYRQVYDAMFEAHDLTKGDCYIREKHSKLSMDDFHTILRYIAFICLKIDKIEFSKDEILSIITKANAKCEFIDFEESMFLNDLISTVPLFTKEGLYYKWTHKSLYEYFSAQFIYLDAKEKQKNILISLVNKSDNYKYNNIFDIYQNIDYKIFRNTIVYETVKKFLSYCNKSYNDFNKEDESIIMRQELSYEENKIIMQVDSKVASSLDVSMKHDARIDYCFSLFKKEKVGEYGIRSIDEFFNSENLLNNVYLFEDLFYPYRSNIKHILKLRKDKLVKLVKSDPNLDLKNFTIEKNKVFKVNDDTQNVLNDEKYFKRTNEIIKIYSDSDVIFDYKNCIDFVENLEQSNIEEKESDFFNIL